MSDNTRFNNNNKIWNNNISTYVNQFDNNTNTVQFLQQYNSSCTSINEYTYNSKINVYMKHCVLNKQ